MFSRIARRGVGIVVSMLAASVVVFGAIRILPGDPISFMLGAANLSNPSLVASFRHDYLLDAPLPAQYLAWLSHIARGDLGQSVINGRPVFDLVLQRLGASAVLGLTGSTLGIVVGISWGVAVSYSRGTVRRALRAGPLLLMVTPSFAVGLVLVFIFAVTLKILPPSGIVFPVGGGGILDVASHTVLPAVTLAMYPAAITARVTYGAIDEIEREDFVRTARALGLSDRRVAFRHTFPNALLPVVTMGGLVVSAMITNAVFIESTFAWPGIGTMMVQAVQSRDYPVVQGGALAVAAIFILISAGVDGLYAMLDPRIGARARANA